MLELDAYMQRADAPKTPEGISIRLLEQSDVDQVVRAYPEELRWAMTDREVRQLVAKRLSSRMPAYIAVTPSGDVLGGTWCLDIARSSIRKIPRFADLKGYEAVSTFLVPEARGKGIAAALKHYSMQQMYAQGFEYVANQIRSDRVASIRMNESLGFRTVAVEERYCTLGVRWVKVFN